MPCATGSQPISLVTRLLNAVPIPLSCSQPCVDRAVAHASGNTPPPQTALPSAASPIVLNQLSVVPDAMDKFRPSITAFQTVMGKSMESSMVACKRPSYSEPLSCFLSLCACKTPISRRTHTSKVHTVTTVRGTSRYRRTDVRNKMGRSLSSRIP